MLGFEIRSSAFNKSSQVCVDTANAFDPREQLTDHGNGRWLSVRTRERGSDHVVWTFEQELLEHERTHRVPEYDDREVAVTLGDFPIHPVRVFDNAIPAVAVRHVARRAALGNALTVPTVIMRIDAVSCPGERLRKSPVPGSVLRHPV